MIQHDLSQDVEQARQQLRILLGRLEKKDVASGPPEVKSELNQLMEMLDRMQVQYGLLLEILARATGALYAKDLEGRYVMMNPEGAEMLGVPVEQILGHDDTALFDSAGAGRIMDIDRAVMSTGSSRTYEDTFVIRGLPITLLTTQTAWYEPQGKLRGLIGSAQDVTERKRVERGSEDQQKRLRSLASEIVITEERLRQSLAADLHSGLGQDIALTKMKLSALRLASSVDLHDSLALIEKLVEQADRSLQSITLRLSPPSLHDLGLVPAFQWLAEDLHDRYGLHVRVEDPGATTVADDPMRVILFRAVRELLTNAAMHAGVREARLWLGQEGDELRIIVEDQGAGFDAARVDLQGYGLFGIREQLRHVGGTMHIDSTTGRGTTVSLTVPCATRHTGVN